MEAHQTQWGGSPWLAVAVATLLYLPPQALAVSEGYLAAVQAEVDEIHTGRFALPAGSPWTRGGAQLGKLDATSPEYQAFDKLLHTRLLGTYIQYKRLTSAQQMALFQAYVIDGDLNKTRRSVLDTLKKKR